MPNPAPEPAAEPAPADDPREHVLSTQCPHCGMSLEVSPSQAGSEVSCPDCREVFLVPTDDGSVPAPTTPQEEFNGLRIRQLMLARRAVYRGWGFMVFGAGICIVCAGQLLYNAYRSFGAGGADHWVGMYVTASILLLGLAGHLWRRGSNLKRELERSRMEEPTTQPDFTPLSDGSQRVRNLERLGGNDPGRAGG